MGAGSPHHEVPRLLIRGLSEALARGISHLRVCLDSALVVNQLNGTWQVKAEHLKPLHEQADSLVKRLAEVQFSMGAS